MTPLRLADPAPPPPARDSIAVWLDTLGVLLRMPAAKQGAIRDELENHLRERVRDLMLSGVPEPDAARAAIGELGDAVKLAARLRAAAGGPRRRHIMAGVAIFGVAGAALVTSLVALQQGGGGNVVVERALVPGHWEIVRSPYVPQQPQEPKDLRVSISPSMSFIDFVKQVADSSGKTVVVRWKLLDAVGAAEGANLPVENTLTNLTLREAFRMINEGLEPKSDGLDFRTEGDRLTIATTEYFDKQEAVLVAYDLSAQVAERSKLQENKTIVEVTEQVTEQVSGVIRDLVHSELWRENGGDRAGISVYGSKLFIRAPKRFHPDIEWVIAQLPASTTEAEAPSRSGPLIGDVGRVMEIPPEVAADIRRQVKEQLEPKPENTAPVGAGGGGGR